MLKELGFYFLVLSILVSNNMIHEKDLWSKDYKFE